ncbi:hypothetical protein BJ165DRAFT_285964 [Panaeolus papilionaceus]|nr:hypothetical protein BJ165DRAFT_285964 [Panaeolus papilionaceus]
MIPALPYDIWSIIYMYLPKEHRCSLYSVNSALFHLSMDEWYSDLNALKLNDEHTSRCLSNISPIVAGRVKSLALRPQLFRAYLKDVEQGSASIWRGIFRGTLQSILKPRATSVQGQALLNNIENMTALSYLKVDCYLSEDVCLLMKSMRFIKSGWIGPAWLSKLELQAPLDTFQDLVASAPKFHNLTDLILTPTRGYLHITKQEAEIRSFSAIVADFVNSKCNNTTSLSIVFPYFPMAIDPFFASLQPMPRLSSLSVVLPTYFLKVDDLMGFHAFLSTHANSLRVLSMGFDQVHEAHYNPVPENVLVHPIFSIKFPNLTSFTIQPVYSRMTRGFSEFLGSYLSPFRSTLEQLRIRCHVFTFDQLKVFLDSLKGEGNVLKVLQVELRYLKCEFFQYLSTNFTQLEEIDVGFSFPREDDAAIIPPLVIPGDYDWGEYDRLVHLVTKQFCERIRLKNYAKWSLRKLQMNYKSFDPDDFSYNASRHYTTFKRSIANALPSVVSFNGQDRETFIGTSE